MTNSTKTAASTDGPRQQAQRWLDSFERALQAHDFQAAADLFEEDGFVRDLVALSWNIRRRPQCNKGVSRGGRTDRPTEELHAHRRADSCGRHYGFLDPVRDVDDCLHWSSTTARRQGLDVVDRGRSIERL